MIVGFFSCRHATVSAVWRNQVRGERTCVNDGQHGKIEGVGVYQDDVDIAAARRQIAAGAEVTEGQGRTLGLQRGPDMASRGLIRKSAVGRRRPRVGMPAVSRPISGLRRGPTGRGRKQAFRYRSFAVP